QGQPLPPEYGPPPYEATLQPGFVPPHVPGEGGYYAPPGHFPHPIAEHYGPGPSHFAPGHTATVLAPPGAATTTTVTVLQGEMFQAAPVQTVCPHCQQPIITCISHDIGLTNTLICMFCFFVGCIAGCCVIPFCMDGCKDIVHKCPKCRSHIKTCKKL
uniref:Cell death-inducing p53-target protein 1 n=1 Tax=Sinocyclocheilus grahami TaxID=75366 RepID=A0A672QK05_SINGR